MEPSMMMFGVGAVGLFGSAIALVNAAGRKQQLSASQRITCGSVPESGPVKLEGRVSSGSTLVAPLSGVECVHYSTAIFGRRALRDRSLLDGNDDDKDVELYRSTHWAPNVVLGDATGEVDLDAEQGELNGLPGKTVVRVKADDDTPAGRFLRESGVETGGLWGATVSERYLPVDTQVFVAAEARVKRRRVQLGGNDLVLHVGSEEVASDQAGRQRMLAALVLAVSLIVVGLGFVLRADEQADTAASGELGSFRPRTHR